MRTLFLDAGHTDGKDPGACANGTTEHAEVAAIIETLAKSIPCRVVPKHLLLPAKIAWINSHAKETDILVSIHMNSGPPAATGLEVYYYGGSESSRSRGTHLRDLLLEQLPLPARKVLPDSATRFKRLGIIRDTTPWAFLIELGFITNAADLQIVRKDSATALASILPLWLKSFV